MTPSSPRVKVKFLKNLVSLSTPSSFMPSSHIHCFEHAAVLGLCPCRPSCRNAFHPGIFKACSLVSFKHRSSIIFSPSSSLTNYPVYLLSFCTFSAFLLSLHSTCPCNLLACCCFLPLTYKIHGGRNLDWSFHYSSPEPGKVFLTW